MQPGRAGPPGTETGFATTGERRLLQLQTRVLESIATGSGPGQGLDLLTRLIEETVPGAIATVMLLDPHRRCLHLVAGPSVPAGLAAELDGLEPRVDMGSCGSAAATGQPAIVDDTGNDPRWAGLRDLAARWDIRACWSLPILSDDATVLGTVAISHSTRRTPDDFEHALLETTRHLAGIAIKKDLVQREKQQLEEQLRRTHKLEALGRLAGGISHDFNNLLTALFGHYDFLARRLVPGRLVARADVEELEHIHDAAERAARLVRQLLVFARQQPREPAEVDPDEVLAGLERMLSRVLREDVALELVPAGEPLRILADEGQLAQAVLDLVLNARDAMPEGGRLVITCAAERYDATHPPPRPDVPHASYVRISVVDSGVGIRPEHLGRIFEPFFTTKAEAKGTGLGLAGVHGFVQSCRGFVHVESRPGEGTRFDLLFPPAGAPRPSAPGPGPKDRGGDPGPAWHARDDNPVAAIAGARLLLCEDDPHVRGFVERLLRESGYEVASAGDADEAERLCDAATDPFDLVLTDLVLPGRNGTELISALRLRRPGLPALLISGYSDRLPAAEGPALSVLRKPFVSGTLLEQVHTMLTNRCEEPR